MIQFIFEYWLELAFGIIVSVLGFVYKKITLHYKMIISTKNGVQVLLKDEIIKYYLQINSKNNMTLYEKELIYDLYKEYKNLGGNGIIEDIINKIEAIPLDNGDD